MLSPTGRRVSRRGAKDPVRVATGKRAAEGDNHFSKVGAVRSSHLGYDCYVTGAINSSGKTRIVLRQGRLPPHLTTDTKLMLPVEMWWPERDHRAAHGLIDAVLSFDSGALNAWKSQWPDHEFGFEQFLQSTERRKLAMQGKNAADAPQVPKRVSSSQNAAGTAARNMRMFPGNEISSEPQGGYDEPNYSVRLKLVRFDDDLSALRIDVGGQLADGQKLLCTRAYVDLLDGRFEIVENYPGRLDALGLPRTLIYRVLGLRSPGVAPQRLLREPAPVVDRMRKVDRTIAASRKAQAVLAEGDPLAEGPVAKRVEPVPVPVRGNQRYEDELASRPDDPEAFPEAPGRGP
jgi:hypothetical protein